MPAAKIFYHEKPSMFDRGLVILLTICVIYLVGTRGNCPSCDEYKQVLQVIQQGKAIETPNKGLATSSTSKSLVTSAHSSNRSSSLWQNQNDIVHILTTRFMQLQPDLLHLGRARLDLFKTFTFPSVIAQTTDEFLWTIFTDPRLHPKLLSELIDLVKPHKNIVLIGMNDIFKDFVYEDWVDRMDVIFSGDIQMVKDYQAAAKTHVLVETRLDADDSIFRDMMKNVQLQTAKTLVNEAKAHNYDPNSFNPKQFRVFCTEHHIEWGYFNPWDPKSTKGHLFGVDQPEFCVTAGLTYAYQIGTTSKDMPTRAHNKMARLIPQCGIGANRTNTNCIERIDAGDYKYIMIRSRTPTSTAMQGVIPTKRVVESKEWQSKQDETWATVMERNFAVTPDSIFRLRENFKVNMKNILQDALKGQCAKHEFTCKDSSIKTLNKLLSEVDKHS